MNEALREQLELAVETAGLGFWQLDLATGQLEWNDRQYEIHGLTRGIDEPYFDTWRELVVPEDRELVLPLSHALEGRRIQGVDFRIRRPDGEIRHITASASPVYEDGRIVGLMGINVDVTPTRRAQADLRDKEGWIEALFLHSLVALVVARDDGTILRVNGAAAELFGIPIEDLAVMRVHDLPLGPRDAGEHYEAFLEEGQEAGEIVVERRDGGRRIAQYRAVRVSADVNLSVLIDITEHRALLEQSHNRQRLAAVGRLAGGIAHDFNNILTIVVGQVHLAREVAPGDNELLLESLDEIQAASERASSLVMQLLAFSRQTPESRTVVDVNRVVRDLERLLRRMIGGDVQLVTRLRDRPGPIRIDEGQLAQVLMNLAVNARDAMPSGGRLVIETTDVSAARTGVIAERVGDHVLLVVEDSGVGMDPATADRVFEPFFSTKPPGQGNGLGLATVYGIVEQCGGAIAVQSAPGQGARFEIVLPLAEPEAASEPLPEPRRAPKRPRVLLVEDEPRLRVMLRRIVASAGYDVVLAEDGDHALIEWSRHGGDFDLVVTDLVMPRLSGRELAARLRAERPTLKVVFISGFEEAVDETLPGPLLGKPFVPNALLEAIDEALEREA